jgi:hypothetical protein
MEEIGARAASALAAAEGTLTTPGVTPASIRDSIATIARLRPIEEALQPYYRRAYENRLEADSEVMRGLLKIWRVVQATGDRGLRDRFQFIGDWIARHHHHGARPAAPATPPTPPTT